MYCTMQLVQINQPDLVIFVGEALVGNEAVDQLTKFNQAMVDFAVVCVGGQGLRLWRQAVQFVFGMHVLCIYQ